MENNPDFNEQQATDEGPRIPSPGLAQLRKTASKVFLALFLYTFVPLCFDLILEYSLLYFMGAEAFLALGDSVWFSWGIGIGIPYLIGIPIVFIFAKKIPAKPRETHSLSLSGFLLFIAVGWAAMMTGAMIGNVLNGILSRLLGHEIVNGTSELISETPIWLIFLIAVIVGPIVEEFLYRKFLIDRIAPFGEGFAVIVSAAAFAFFHGNLYQFFYAFGLGLILGYIYIRTGKMRYNVLLHMVVNFFGSVIAVPVTQAAERISAAGGDINAMSGDLISAYLDIGLVFSYEMISFGLAVTGICLFVRMKNSFRVDPVAEIPLSSQEKKSGLVNLGVILFLILAALQIVLNLK